MARTEKALQPVDLRIAEILKLGTAGKSLRDLAADTGMSVNRLGIILRQQPPPATVGEVSLIARTFGATASAIIAEAESPTSVVDATDRFDRSVRLPAVARAAEKEPTDEQ